jgi:hypothetical protein
LSGLVLAGLVTAWLLFRSNYPATVALAWSLLWFAVLHPTTQPWYLTWGLMLWAATSAGGPNRFYVVLTAAAAFVVLPAGPRIGDVVLENHDVLSLAMAAGALGLLTLSLMGFDAGRRSTQVWSLRSRS